MVLCIEVCLDFTLWEGFSVKWMQGTGRWMCSVSSLQPSIFSMLNGNLTDIYVYFSRILGVSSYFLDIVGRKKARVMSSCFDLTPPR